MAFDAYNSRLPVHVLVEIALDSGTKRVSTEYVTLSDGTDYDGLVSNIGPIRRSAGSILEPRVIFPSTYVDLDNRPDADGNRVQDWLTSDSFPHRLVTISLVQSQDVGNKVTLFEGSIKFPGGVEVSDAFVRLNLSHPRAGDARVLPLNRYTQSTYPNMELAAIGKPIPIVYGWWDFDTGVPKNRINTEKVGAVQIDSTVGTGGKFKIADHAIKSIYAVHKNGTSVSFSSVDLANAEFTLDVSYTSGADQILVYCQGATHDGTPTGNLLEKEADIYNDLLQTWLGVPSGNVDSTAISNWNTYFPASYGEKRRLIDVDIPSDTLLTELLTEGWADPVYRGGKYSVEPRAQGVKSGLTNYLSTDILTQGGNKLFSIQENPVELYCNEVLVNLRRDKFTGAFEQHLVQNSGAILGDGGVQRRTMELQWIFQGSGGLARANLERDTFSKGAGNPVELVSLTMGLPGLFILPTDQFRLIHNRYLEVSGDGTPFMARDVVIHPVQRRAQIVAWNIEGL